MAFFFGKPDHPNWDVNHAFSYHAIHLDLNKIGLKGFYLGYSLLHYLQDKPLHLPFVKYEWKFNEKDGVIFSYTENVRDKSPMFLIGYHRIF